MNNTEAFQRQFAAHLRNPEHNPLPTGLDIERSNIYVELLYNNVEGFLRNCFPVVRKILPDEQWHQLARQFYAQHACHSPYFREIPAEFMQWFTEQFNALELAQHYPFLLELSHYEWLEIPLLVADADLDTSQVNPEGDLLDEPLVLNPVMHMQSYQYPVHRISPEFQPTEPEATHLLLLRDKHNAIQFVELNAVTAQLLQLLQEMSTARAALLKIATSMQHPNPEQLLEYGLQLLQQFRQQQVLLGTRTV